ncbi:hypothetical protein GGU10DRAFT_420057 [Lentinula aff. detonsa]|uniref:Uncharacterized protein n=1 Tax=Lentinula aff. detonsa TaxID=2804958 RepID=A0AA38K7I7_9AGAR|nr:hypothetical protein GGU10DRAFT_420057 [Lentinula aff. detonsa]
MICFSSLTSRLILICLFFTAFLGAISSPLPETPTEHTTSFGDLDGRGAQVDRSRYRSLPIKLMRMTKEGSLITKPNTQVAADEEWTLFIGQDGFRAHPGPSETLTAEHTKSSKTPLGYTPNYQDLGEKASFGSAAERDKVFKSLLTDVPALHKGNGVPQTNLAYLNGIFAYLASSTVKAISTPKPPEEWMKMYNEMYAKNGNA